jgi:Mg2+/Co2+ transporter CorB
VQAIALAVLLALSGFFSLAETAMMAANRYRLRHLAKNQQKGAQLALDLLGRTDKLLGIILIFNNLINAAAATLVSVITLELFGEKKWALGVGTLGVTFLILVFSEITPKVIGASLSDRLAPLVSFILTPLLRVFYFAVWFVNLFVSALLWMIRLKPQGSQPQQLSAEELRSLVLEAGHFIPKQHRSILLNLFELERVTVEDIMTPRGAIEAIDIGAPVEDIKAQLATSYHTRLPVYEEDPNNVVGIIHQRRLIAVLMDHELDRDRLRELLAEPYFVPAATPIYAQLQFFQDNQQRMGLIVDEYGELLGLVTLEDIIEEIIGKFTTSIPTGGEELEWGEDGSVLVEGGRPLRELNRRLALNLPLDGPKTLNGLILEHFRDIPEAGVSVKIADVPMEIVQTQDRMVRMVKLYRPSAAPS